MKRSMAILTVFILVAISICAQGESFAAGREKIVVAIGQFEDGTGKNLGKAATDYVTNTFIQLKYFVVIERSRIDQVMREVAHQQTGMVNEATAAQVGKQLGAKAIVLGSVTVAQYSIEQQKCVEYDSKGNEYKVPCKIANASVTLNIRMVNVETGEVFFSELLSSSTSETYRTKNSVPASEVSMLEKALQGAAHKVYPLIQKAFPLSGVVLKKDGEWIWIDVGTEWGLGTGRGVIIYSGKGAPIKHPTTGEIIGYDREEVASDHVSEVMPTMCKVKVSKKEAAKINIGDVAEFKPQIFY